MSVLDQGGADRGDLAVARREVRPELGDGEVLVEVRGPGGGHRGRIVGQRSRVARLEREAWVSYYERRWIRLLVVSVALVQASFRMGPAGTLIGAWHVLRANQLWAEVPDNDPIGAFSRQDQCFL